MDAKLNAVVADARRLGNQFGALFRVAEAIVEIADLEAIVEGARDEAVAARADAATAAAERDAAVVKLRSAEGEAKRMVDQADEQVAASRKRADDMIADANTVANTTREKSKLDGAAIDDVTEAKRVEHKRAMTAYAVEAAAAQKNIQDINAAMAKLKDKLT